MTFDELKAKIESNDPQVRRAGIDTLYLHYLSMNNNTLRKIANQEMFQQLRPLYSVEDVLGRAMEKVRKRLENGRLQLRTEKHFLSYVTFTIRMIVLDLNRRQRLALIDDDPMEVIGTKPGREEGVSTAFMEQEMKTLLLTLLEELLTTEEMYLIRRHYFESATYEEIANEVLRPAVEPLNAEEQQKRYDNIRMRIKRVRDKLKEHHEELLPLLVA
jgi:RNA polymerase sigma factor (sigma-70 family)